MNTEEGKGFLRLYTWFEKCQTGLSRSYLYLRANSREILPIHALSTTFFLLLSFELPVLDITIHLKVGSNRICQLGNLNLDLTFLSESRIKIQESSSESWIRWIQKYHRSPNRILRCMPRSGFECWVGGNYFNRMDAFSERVEAGLPIKPSVFLNNDPRRVEEAEASWRRINRIARNFDRCLESG